MIAFKNCIIGHKQDLFSIDSLELKQGHLYALVGPNGSGKSTLLQTIAGLVPPVNGEFTIQGVSKKHLSQKELALKVAWVDSHFTGIEYMRVREYVSLGRLPYTNHFGSLKASDYDKIDQVIETMNLQTKATKFTKELSDGERQMVAIARALAQDTPILLLDEPTAFLDFGNKSKLVSHLKQIAENENKCIILSTHDIDTCIDFQLYFLILDKEKELIFEKNVQDKYSLFAHFTERTN